MGEANKQQITLSKLLSLIAEHVSVRQLLLYSRDMRIYVRTSSISHAWECQLVTKRKCNFRHW